MLPNPPKQFYYTNSEDQLNRVDKLSTINLPIYAGFASDKKEPIFCGKTIDYYDEIIQGHVHFKMLTEDDKVKIRTIRAAAITEMIQLTLLRTLL